MPKKEAAEKTKKNGSSANLGFEQTLWAAAARSSGRHSRAARIREKMIVSRRRDRFDVTNLGAVLFARSDGLAKLELGAPFHKFLCNRLQRWFRPSRSDGRFVLQAPFRQTVSGAHAPAIAARERVDLAESIVA